VYQRYLNNLAPILVQTEYQHFNEFPTNQYTRKYCRYCNDGAWSDIESCVTLNCDREQLTGEPEIMLINPQKVSPSHQTLFMPGSAVAIYTYGVDKFCRQCQSNGEWSRHSLMELCEYPILQQPFIYRTLLKQKNKSIVNNKSMKQPLKSSTILNKNENKEMACSLKSIEEDSNFTRLYFISPDRQRKFKTPKTSDLIESRTLSIYHRVSTSN
jgi:hypothetical protein